MVAVTMATVKFTDDTFDQDVLKSNTPVMVDFWAEWCTPCQMVGPIVDELAKEYSGKVKVGKLNIDENAQTPGQYNVMSIPSLMIFKDGKPVKTFVGVQSKDTLKKGIDEALAA